jgi:hypothetical protein
MAHHGHLLPATNSVRLSLPLRALACCTRLSLLDLRSRYKIQVI